MSKPKASARSAAPSLDSVTVVLELPVPQDRLFRLVSDPSQLPKWADPIKAVRRDGGRAVVDYELPDRRVECPCDTDVDAARGTADWTVHLPDAPALKVYSRAVAVADDRSVFVLTLVSPPFGPMRVKNARALMEKNLAKDLDRLKALVGA